MPPLDILRQYWGYDQFRPLQEEIVESVLAGKDTLALLPTGGGKSVCFQVPALVREGMAIVISPLIALMKDQVERLHQLGIPAAFVNSAMQLPEVDAVLQAAMDGAYKFLYMAPERIGSQMFKLRFPKMPVDFLVVDEAHCISQWGYDFRPAYLEITQIRAHKPDIPIIALTASATHRVRDDILDKLEMRSPAVFQKSFRRDNLRYFVLNEENAGQRTLDICQRTQGTGIVYVRTRKLSMALAEMLTKNGLSAAAYHGGLPTSERDLIQQAWIEDQTRIIVATNAFGMGIDKPDVRFVVHYNMPFDLESYYQEAGRGGRDGQTALAIAFNNPIDIAEAARWNAGRYPGWEQLNRHYDQLCRHFKVPHTGTVFERHAFDLKALATELREPALAIYNSIRLLDREGLLKLEEESDDYGWIRVKAAPRDILTHKNHNQKEAVVLDHALRSLGGEVYRWEMRFLPGRWAEILGIQAAEIHRLLDRLVQHDMITFKPPRNHPAITFFEPRRRLARADLNWDKYVFLRQQADQRFEIMLDYLQGTALCRSLLIQHYFGEETHNSCGRCDVCIGRHKTKVSDEDFQVLRDAILAFVEQRQPSYRQVVLEAGAGTPAQREKVLRYLIDKQAILVAPAGTLKLRE